MLESIGSHSEAAVAVAVILAYVIGFLIRATRSIPKYTI
jgi:hypothetical protein